MAWNGPKAKISRLKNNYFMINKGKPPEKRHDPEREPQCQDIVGQTLMTANLPLTSSRRPYRFPGKEKGGPGF